MSGISLSRAEGTAWPHPRRTASELLRGSEPLSINQYGPAHLRTLLWAWPEGLNGNRSCPPTEFFSARAMKLHAFVDRFGSWIRTIPVGRDTSRVEMEFWRAAADKSGTLWFHPPDVPIRVWAITIQPAGVIWAESAIGRISARRHVRLKPQRRRGQPPRCDLARPVGTGRRHVRRNVLPLRDLRHCGRRRQERHSRLPLKLRPRLATRVKRVVRVDRQAVVPYVGTIAVRVVCPLVATPTPGAAHAAQGAWPSCAGPRGRAFRPCRDDQGRVSVDGGYPNRVTWYSRRSRRS